MSDASNKKHYIAFISYSTADEKWAKWLWFQLEHYIIPAKLRKEYPHLPKYLRPVFWYKQDLSGTHLQSSLNKELEASQYLIVLCSPSSAKSEWVNKEILHFLELGWGNKIIPIFIDGRPHAANPSEECLPPALYNLPPEKELRGIDLRRKEGKKHAFVDVVATILGVRFNEVWGRHQRRKRKIIRRIVMAVVLMIFCITMQVQYKKPYIEYYADYVDQWGVPKGVIPLTKEQCLHRHDSYRFTYSRIPLSEPNGLEYRLKEVALVNSVDEVIEHSNLEFIKRSAIMRIRYSEQTGLPTQILYAEADGTVKYRHDLSTRNSVVAAIADFKSATEDMGSAFMQANTASMDRYSHEPKVNIKRFAYERDENGYYSKITYHSNNDDNLANSMACDANGIYGARFYRDSIGRILRVEYIDKQGDITATHKGVAGYEYTYDKTGSVNSYFYFDTKGEAVLNDQEWARSIELIDEYGNTYRGYFYDQYGNLCNCSEGYAQFQYEHDEYGNKIKKLHYDVDTALCLTNEGYSIWTKKFNILGRCTETAYFGTDGQPCLCQQGYAKVVQKFNIMGYCTEERYFGVDGQPCMCIEGYSMLVNKYDLWDNCVYTAYYDTEGKPAMFLGMCACIRREFDSYGRAIQETYYDVNDNPFSIDGSSAVMWRAKYNSLGYIIEHSCHDSNGKLCVCADGTAIIRLKMNARGDVIEMAYYDDQQKPCKIIPEGYFKEVLTYDDRGNCTEIKYYGLDNKLCLYCNKYAIARRTFDAKGNVVSESYYDTAGRRLVDL